MALGGIHEGYLSDLEVVDEESGSMKKYLCQIKVDARKFKKWTWNTKT